VNDGLLQMALPKSFSATQLITLGPTVIPVVLLKPNFKKFEI